MKSAKVITVLLIFCLMLCGCGFWGKYTLETLGEKIGDIEKYSSRETEIGKMKCLDIWFPGVKTDDDLYYDECNYYIFKNNYSARKAFNYMKRNWIGKETDSGKNNVQGWEKGVDDASVEIYIQITQNMIITTEVQVTSEWTYFDSEDMETEYSSPSIHLGRVEFIKKNFN